MRLSSVYGAGLGRPDAAWGGAGDLLQPLPRVSSDICRRCPSTSAADLFRPLRQTSDDLCGRPRSISAAEVGAHLPQASEGAAYPPVLSPFFHELDRPRHILRRVDADGFLMGDAHLDPVAVFQPAQLLQALGLLQLRLGQRGDLAERRGPVGVEPDVLVESARSQPLRVMLAPDVGDDRTAEIERLHPLVEYDFGRVGVEERALEIAVWVERLDERGDLRRGVVEATLQGLDLLRVDKGLVALDIDDHLETGAHLLVSLVAAIRTAPVLVGGHDGLSAERADSRRDPLVVGGDTDRVENTFHLLINPLDHGFPFHVGQRLARKSGRGVAGRDNANECHIIRYDVCLMLPKLGIYFIFATVFTDARDEDEEVTPH